MKICKNCDNEFQEKEKTQKFCSRSCSVSYGNKHRKLTEETKNKISQSVSKSISKKWEDPSYRDKIIKALKGRKGFKHSEETKRKIGLSNKNNYREKDPKHIYQVSSRTRSKILKRLNLKCSNCGWDKHICDLHHIKGRKILNPHNHDNLSYLCPNCHRLAQLNIIPTNELITFTEQIGESWKNYYYIIEGGVPAGGL